jgi:hypothetical protein
VVQLSYTASDAFLDYSAPPRGTGFETPFLTFSQNLNDVAALNQREAYGRGNMPRPAEVCQYNARVRLKVDHDGSAALLSATGFLQPRRIRFVFVVLPEPRGNATDWATLIN